jgi:hypothetical protein
MESGITGCLEAQELSKGISESINKFNFARQVVLAFRFGSRPSKGRGWRILEKRFHEGNILVS